MCKDNHLIRRVAVLALLLMAVQPAFALLTIKNPVVNDLSGKPVSGATLQLYYGGPASTPSPATAPYYSGTLYTTQFPNTGSDGISLQTVAITESGLSVVLKAWKGTPVLNSYYGFITGSSGGTKDTLRIDSGVIKTNFKAAPPYTPTFNSFQESTTTNASDGKKTSTLNVNVGQPAATDGDREGSTYTWQMGVSGSGTLTTVTGQTGATLSLSASQVTAGTTYTFKVMCSGPWGDSAYAQQDYTVAGAGGGAASFTFNLLPIDPTKLVVNTVFLPTTGSLTKASDLAAKVDTLAGFHVTQAVCKWDPIAGQPVAALFDSSGALVSGSNNFALAGGECYQIYTTKAVSITLP